MNTTGSIFLMRHGETDNNRLNVWQCTRDVPLNENGREQAREIIPIINSIKPEIVITSDLDRARETASIACSSLDKVEYIVERRFRERSCGLAEGLATTEVRKRFGLTGILDGTEIDRIPGAEPYAEFRERVMEVMESYSAELSGRKALIVSHGGVMRTFYYHAIDPMYDAHVFRNCSIISLAKTSHSWELIDTYNTG